MQAETLWEGPFWIAMVGTVHAMVEANGARGPLWSTKPMKVQEQDRMAHPPCH